MRDADKCRYFNSAVLLPIYTIKTENCSFGDKVRGLVISMLIIRGRQWTPNTAKREDWDYWIQKRLK